MTGPARLSLAATALAFLTASGGLFGLWDVRNDTARPVILLASTASLVLLLTASLLILRQVRSATTAALPRRIAWLCLASLILCMGGDVINFNLPQSFYRHGELIRHDYLADSVWCFAPGYGLLLAATLMTLRLHGRLSAAGIGAALGVAALAGALSFASMYLSGSGRYIAVMTGGYALLITAVGMAGALLLASNRFAPQPVLVWWVAAGLVLAALADALIGQFWIYGNTGQGHFPLVRDLNWMIYITSQALVIHLPVLALRFSSAATKESDR